MPKRSRNRVTVPVSLVSKLDRNPGDEVVIVGVGMEQWSRSAKIDKYKNVRFPAPGKGSKYDLFVFNNHVLISE